MFDSIFSDGELRKYIENNIKDPWEKTNFKDYVYLSPKCKGIFGEIFLEKYLKELDYTVTKRKNSGHDRIIENKKVEIKFSLCTKYIKDNFIINHISKEKDWDILIFVGVNPKEQDLRVKWFSKENFIEDLKKEDTVFKHQQGGKKIKNDDYICTGYKTLS
jgi:hypothetical protein